MAQDKTLKQQLQAMNTGDVIVTDATRATAFVNAKRAGIKITTEQTDKGLRITHAGEVLTPKVSDLELCVLYLRQARPEDRLKVFALFELCCGMNRGSCICPEEPIGVSVQPFGLPLAYPETERIHPDLGLADFIAKAQAKKGIVAHEPVGELVEADEWLFTAASNRPQQHDNGNFYREQYLVSNPKKKRTVRVDEDNLDLIIETP